MTAEPSEVLRAGLALPPADRESVAMSLLDSLANDADNEGVDAVWSAEIERRAASVLSGSVVGEPWSTVRTKVAERLSSKRP